MVLKETAFVVSVDLVMVDGSLTKLKKILTGLLQPLNIWDDLVI
jgi:hypothetical protein